MPEKNNETIETLLAEKDGFRFLAAIPNFATLQEFCGDSLTHQERFVTKILASSNLFFHYFDDAIGIIDFNMMFPKFTDLVIEKVLKNRELICHKNYKKTLLIWKVII